MNYSDQNLSVFPWIVSCGTLRSEDLLVRFWSIAAQLGGDLSPILSTLERLAGEDSREVDWSEEEAQDTIGRLFDILQDCAPEGFYFGASEGDGACFGFWLIEGWQTALDVMGLGDCDPSGWAALIASLVADGIDPENIEDAYAGRAEGRSEVVAGADYAMGLAQDVWLPESPGGIGWNCWPISCIDWQDAWRELQMGGGGYRLQDIGGGDWLVFRNF